MAAGSGRKRALFIAFLAVNGVLAALIVVGILTWAGLLRYEWSDRLRQERAFAQAAGRQRRILVLGDSLLKYWPIPHSLATDIDLHAQRHGIGLVNSAEQGIGPYEYRDRLERLDHRLRPSLVLLFYNVGNDLTDVMSHFVQPARRPKELRPMARGPGNGHGLYDWEWMRVGGIDPGLITMAKNRMERPNEVSGDLVNPGLLMVALTRKRVFLDNIFIDSPEARRAWREAKALLEQIVKRTRARGAELCIVVLPSTVQVDRSHFDMLRRATFALDERLLTSTRPQELLAAFCKEHRVRCVDLLPAFRKHHRTGELYWRNDDHFSEPGHILAFEVLRREFLDAWIARKP